MRKKLGLVLLGALLLAGCSKEGEADPGKKPKEKTPAVVQVKPDVIAEDLKVPWSIAKAGDVLYLTERPGAIVKIENGKMERQRVELKEQLSDASEAGLLGFVLDPEFPDKQSAFAYYTYNDAAGQKNRVVVLAFQNGEWREERTLIDGLPSGPVHHGGRLEIGPDGKLYITAGDAANPELAQDRNALGGKILRMNLDGGIPADNPITGSYVYSYGHRNPQGLAWLADGTMVASEHGQSAHDESILLNRAKTTAGPTSSAIKTSGEWKRRFFIPAIKHGLLPAWPSGGISCMSRRSGETLSVNLI